MGSGQLGAVCDIRRVLCCLLVAARCENSASLKPPGGSAGPPIRKSSFIPAPKEPKFPIPTSPCRECPWVLLHSRAFEQSQQPPWRFHHGVRAPSRSYQCDLCGPECSLMECSISVCLERIFCGFAAGRGFLWGEFSLWLCPLPGGISGHLRGEKKKKKKSAVLIFQAPRFPGGWEYPQDVLPGISGQTGTDSSSYKTQNAACPLCQGCSLDVGVPADP